MRKLFPCIIVLFAQLLLAQNQPDIIEGISRPESGTVSVALGSIFESRGAGISFLRPAGSKEIRKAGLADEIVEFINEEKGWVLKVGLSNLQRPVPLVAKEEKGVKQAGMLELAVDQLKAANPGLEVLRQDVVNIGPFDAGIIAVRYTLGTQRKLMQQGLIQAADKLYYTFKFTTPGARGKGDEEEDPREREAVEVFRRILDSVRITDREQIRLDQEERLYRTRALFVNLSEKKLRESLIPQQWLRLIRDGKDIGYTYIIEEVATRGGGDGVLISMRARTIPEAGSQVDIGSEIFVTFNRRHENWAHVISTELKGQRNYASEFGASDRTISRKLGDPQNLGEKIGGNVDAKQPDVRQTESYVLNVTYVGKAGTAEPLNRELPPWYLPQALGHLLPRLVPLHEPKTYLFATYVSEQREVMARYVDVEGEQMVVFNGQKIRAIPIRDRLGLEGVITTHYLSPLGKYLGSQTTYGGEGGKGSIVLVLPSDEATLLQLWKDAVLKRPDPIEMPKGAGTSR